MLFRQLIGIAPFLLHPLCVSTQQVCTGTDGPCWTLSYFYDGNNNCAETEGTGGSETFGPLQGPSSGCDHGTNGDTYNLNSLSWNSGGPQDQESSYFVCFYSDTNCESAIATLPEGNTGCLSSGFPNSWGSSKVFTSDSPGC